MTCADGQEIQGWLIPPFSADRVVAEGDGVLTRRYPGVVVAHGLGFSHEQYLNLAQQLHQAACTVLMVDTRGQGESPPATITFGVREKLDIAAALSCLRHVSYSDQTRLGVVGYGASGAAALQAAALDPSIGAVVADAVRPSFAEELACNLDNPVLPGRYLACPYEMTFELMVRERLGALNLCPVVAAIHRSTVLVVARMQDANDRAQEDAALLASSAGGAHRVLTCAAGGSDGALAPDDAVRVTEFLCQSLHWTAGERSAAVQELLKARVK